LNLYFEQSRFTRNYFTTGTILTHPILNELNVRCDIITNLLFEAFLMIVPFERRDLNFANDKHRIANSHVKEGDKFLAIYDQTYGSLRISGRLAEEPILKRVLEKCVDLSRSSELLDMNQETMKAIVEICTSVSEHPVELDFKQIAGIYQGIQDPVLIIMPGSKGLNVNKNNEEFLVEGVFFSPDIGGLAYRGRDIPEKPSHELVTTIIPISALKDIPGESKLGLYSYRTGEIKQIE
jgi:DEAD/DEAH box helicase domain-containing protein